ncbi:MAG: molybdopterin-dependent oxidoreductase, partial [Dehalococcoidia bacterium]
MGLTRREFLLTMGGSALGAVVFAGCQVPERKLVLESPLKLPEDLVTGVDNWYATLCRQCPGSEGIIVRVMEGRAKKVEGNPDHPMNRGKTSARCQAGVQALYHPDRIQSPLRRTGQRGAAQFQSISWEEGLAELMGQLEQHRGEANAALLVTAPLRGHLGLVVQRFAQAYGAEHLTFEALEETVLRTAMQRLFGQELLPQFDIEHTQYLLSFGAGFLDTWLSPVHYARAYGEFRQGERARRGHLVQVEPRFSMTAANADQWVPIKPGTEGVLALSMAYVIISEGLGDAAVAQTLTGGAGAQALEAFRPAEAEKLTGVPAQRIEELAWAFATERPSLAIGGGPAAAQTNGLFNLTAIFALNFLVDNIGKPGGIRFNPPPPIQWLPPADQATPFGRWQETADRMRRGQVKLALLHGVNPVHGLPGAVDLSGALAQVPFIVSFSSFVDETTAMADLVLPDHVYLEDWGDEVPSPGPGFQTLGLQQPVVRPLYDTRGFGDVLLTVAEGLGMEQALPWGSLRDVLRDGARQLHSLNRGSVQAADFETFWNGILQRGGWWDQEAVAQAQPSPPRLPQEPQLPDFSGKEGFPYHLLVFPTIALTDARGAHLPWLQATPDPVTTV